MGIHTETLSYIVNRSKLTIYSCQETQESDLQQQPIISVQCLNTNIVNTKMSSI